MYVRRLTAVNENSESCKVSESTLREFLVVRDNYIRSSVATIAERTVRKNDECGKGVRRARYTDTPATSTMPLRRDSVRDLFPREQESPRERERESPVHSPSYTFIASI